MKQKNNLNQLKSNISDLLNRSMVRTLDFKSKNQGSIPC